MYWKTPDTDRENQDMKSRQLIHWFMIFIVLTACHRLTMEQTIKMNGRLRYLMKHHTSIRFNGECFSPITAGTEKEIKNTGIRLQSARGALFTATGSPRQIRRLVRLEFIKRLEAVPEYHLRTEEDQ